MISPLTFKKTLPAYLFSVQVLGGCLATEISVLMAADEKCMHMSALDFNSAAYTYKHKSESFVGYAARLCN